MARKSGVSARRAFRTIRIVAVILLLTAGASSFAGIAFFERMRILQQFGGASLAAWWTWMNGGGDPTDFAPVYSVPGVQGVAAASNTLGARYASFTWKDSSGNFWLYGGYGYANSYVLGALSDLWKFNSTTGEWTWVSGSTNTLNVSPQYGTQGVGSTSNTPGSRSFGAAWADSSGNLWLFGGGTAFPGNGLPSPTVSTQVFYNDLWKYTPSNGQWTWVSGSNLPNQTTGTYGTQGTGSTSNIPSARGASSFWTDSSGNFWLYGGAYTAWQTSPSSEYEDLWKYTPSNNQWTWVSGTSSVNQAPSYGTQGTGSTSNLPGARFGATSWIDTSGNFWLFGGGSYPNRLSDLWKYNPSNGQWTWVGGPNTGQGTGTYGTQGTGSTSNIPSSRMMPTYWTDNSGNFWLLGGFGTGILNDLWKFNPSNSQWTWVTGSSSANGAAGNYGTEGVANASNTPGSHEGGGAWVDGSGNLWLFGGVGSDKNTGNSTSIYDNDVWKFNTSTTQWTWELGASSVHQPGIYGTMGVASSTNLPGPRQAAVTWVDSSKNLWLFGGDGNDSTGKSGYLSDLWKYDPYTMQWTWVAGSDLINQTGVYGTAGTASPSNAPGGRADSVGVVDSSGNFWMFSGYGYDSAGAVGPLDDLWKYSPSTRLWTWVSGPNTGNGNATFGIQGTGSTSNITGARYYATGWGDSSNNLWFFGGLCKLTNSSTGYCNDLWKYTISNGQWTWMLGANTVGAASSSSAPGARQMPVSWIDGSGNLWLFGGQSTANWNDLWKYSPSGNSWTLVAGSLSGNVLPVPGTLGVESSSNVIGGQGAGDTAWIDKSGKFWVFPAPDLWQIDPANGYDTWFGGASGYSYSSGSLMIPSASNQPATKGFANSWNSSTGNSGWLFGGMFLGNNAHGNDLWRVAVTTTGAATKLEWFSAVNEVYGTCAYSEVWREDANNNASIASTSLSVTLSQNGSGQFFQDAGCTISTSAITIPSGTYMAPVYFKDTTLETVTLTASSGTLTSATSSYQTVGRTCQFVFTTSSTSPWTVPSDLSNATVEVVGGGGAGATGASNAGAQGGGGGAYSKTTGVSLTHGASVAFSVGTAGNVSYFCNTTGASCAPAGAAVVALANGGTSGASGGAGGVTTGNAVGTALKSAGGAGAAHSSGSGGGGGGAGGPYGAGVTAPGLNGGNGDNNSGGAGDTSGASGPGGMGTEWTGAGTGGGGGGGSGSGVTGGVGGNYGGGGGGGGKSTAAGGNGASGVIVVTYSGTTCS